MSDPFRETRIAPAEVRRVLRRAAELAESDPETAAVEKSLTRVDIERSAEELGIPRTAVARALQSDLDASPATEKNWFLGAPTRIVFEREVAGEPTQRELEDLLEEIRSETGENGAVENVGKTFIWKQTPLAGRGRDFSVRLRSRDGRTRIIVEERFARQATGLFVGLGVGGGIGPMGAYIALISKLGLVALPIPFLWITLMLVLARTIFGVMHKRRDAELRRLFDRVTKHAAGWSSPPLRARVEAEKSTPEETEEEVEEVSARPTVRRPE